MAITMGSGNTEMRRRALARHGILTKSDLTGPCGLTDSAVDRRVRAGELVRLHRGIFRLAAHPRTWEGNVVAAQLAGGEGAFASHRTAGAIYGLDGIPRDVIEVSLYGSRRIDGAVTHRLQVHDRPRLRTLNELQVASLERTIMDLAAVLPDGATGDALDDALRRRLTTLPRIKAALDDALPGRRGSASLRRLLSERDENDEVVRTKFEAKMLWVIRQLPLPTIPNFRLTVEGQIRYLDFAFPAYALGIECHSARWHKAHRPWLRDIARDRQLGNHGWRILYFAWEEVIADPRKVMGEIRYALRDRGALL